MPHFQDGPKSTQFAPLPFAGNVPLDELAGAGISPAMARAVEHAPRGACVGWGMPFDVGDVVLVKDQAVSITFSPTPAEWLVFMHTSDVRPMSPGPGGFISPMRGEAQLAEHAADYVVLYADGTQERVAIRRRRQLGPFQRRWGENCFEAVAHAKPGPVRASRLAITDCG